MSFTTVAAIALLSTATATVAAPSPATQEPYCCVYAASATTNASATNAPTPGADSQCRMSCCAATPSGNVKVAPTEEGNFGGA